MAVGDDLVARGAYQVFIGKTVTLPDSLTNDQIYQYLQALNESNLIYQALVEQKVAPADFAEKASKAIFVACEALKRKIVLPVSESKE